MYQKYTRTIKRKMNIAGNTAMRNKNKRTQRVAVEYKID